MKIKKLIVLNSAALVLVLVCALLSGYISGLLHHMQTTQRWKGESELRFAHISCYFPVTGEKTQDDVYRLRESLDRTLSEAGLSSEQVKTYTDAYCSFGEVTAVSEHGSAELSAVGVGGDFFLFHPLRLLSGSYFSELDLTRDRVVLDELAAWQLFGSYDAAGLYVEIDEVSYYVAGVVERNKDYASGKVSEEKPGIYLSYEALSGMNDAGIASYEIVLPEPVKHFGTGLLRERFAAEEFDEIVEQTNRYSFSNLWNAFMSIEDRMIGGNGIRYPQWEKAVRLTEYHLSLLLIAMLVFSLLPLATIAVLSVRLLWKGTKKAKQYMPEALERYAERRKERKYYLLKEGEQ